MWPQASRCTCPELPQYRHAYGARLKIKTTQCMRGAQHRIRHKESAESHRGCSVIGLVTSDLSPLRGDDHPDLDISSQRSGELGGRGVCSAF